MSRTSMPAVLAQLSPQTLPTSPTQIESHAVWQQYGSTVQMSASQVPQLASSLVPSVHLSWSQVGGGGGGAARASLPQTLWTSPTQIESHAVVQQKGSAVQMSLWHSPHDAASGPPWVQVSWSQVAGVKQAT